MPGKLYYVNELLCINPAHVIAIEKLEAHNRILYNANIIYMWIVNIYLEGGAVIKTEVDDMFLSNLILKANKEIR